MALNLPTFDRSMTASFPSIASVFLEIAIDKPLDYAIPEDLIPLIQVGSFVQVPVKGTLKRGCVIAIKKESCFSKIKPIARLENELPPLSQELLQLSLWIHHYYCAPFSSLFKLLLPSGVRRNMGAKEQFFVVREKTKEELKEYCLAFRAKKPAQALLLEAMLPVKKGLFLSELLEKTKASKSSLDALVSQGLLKLEKVAINRSPLIDEEYFISKPKLLNDSQKEALEKIKNSLDNDRFETHLLFGITGSGKTEVYLQAIDHALKKGHSSLMLVPEISLTEQMIARFKSRFKEKIAILHHRLSEGERNDEWRSIQEGKAQIVIGARSAIFSPLQNLRLIIVDEEHESSYKQNEQLPCYHARDVAVMRGKLSSASVVLGSATPSLESYYNALQGKYTLSKLSQRADAATLASVHIIDMRREYEKAKGKTHFSQALLSAIEKRLDRGEQTLLFLNKRGYHSVMLCEACEKCVKCEQCDVPMTFHLGDNCLACHLCGYRLSPPPHLCPSCGSQHPLKFKGVGTELIEKALHAIFPSIRTLRLDADTTKHKGSHQKILRAFGSGKADLLIGTQMIAKGLHFPEVTLVGVLNSDSSLNIPDFRAAETTFQLLTQVAGRAGRGAIAGEVIIQTALPEHSTIRYAAAQDFEAFYSEEIEVRRMFDYPPFSKMAKLLFSGKEEKKTQAAAEKTRSALMQLLPPQFEFHPVVPCGYAKVKNLFRFQFLIKGPRMEGLSKALQSMKERAPLASAVTLFVDVNPSSTFF